MEELYDLNPTLPGYKGCIVEYPVIPEYGHTDMRGRAFPVGGNIITTGKETQGCPNNMISPD